MSIVKKLVFILISMYLIACQGGKKELEVISEPSVIPVPVSMQIGEGYVAFAEELIIGFENEELSDAANQLVSVLGSASSFEVRSQAGNEGHILLKIEEFL